MRDLQVEYIGVSKPLALVLEVWQHKRRQVE